MFKKIMEFIAEFFKKLHVGIQNLGLMTLGGSGMRKDVTGRKCEGGKLMNIRLVLIMLTLNLAYYSVDIGGLFLGFTEKNITDILGTDGNIW